MEMILACIYVFHQAIAANLDLFYFLSLFLIAADIIARKKLTLKAIGYVYLIVLYALLHMLTNNQIEVQRLIINLAKLFLNVFLFLQVSEMRLPHLSLKKTINVISIFNLILLLAGLVIKTDLLWRLDDNVNIYQKARFSLLYFEPSEASFHVCLLIVLYVYYVLREKDYKRNLINIFFIATNCVIVVLSAGMGGMLSLSLACMTMYFYYLREKISVGRMLMFIVLVFTGVFAMIAFIFSNNSFYLRMNDIMSGHDGSVVYRFDISFRVMKEMLIESSYLGIGFGNLNTDSTRSVYSSFGLVEVISNSFMYVIAEGGIAAIVFLVCLFIVILSRVRSDEKILKYALFIFIFSYQIAGGYFTNPINWMIYGLIANKVFMRETMPHQSVNHHVPNILKNQKLELDS